MRSEKKQGILLSIGKLTTVRKSIIFLVGDRIIVDLYKNICFPIRPTNCFVFLNTWNIRFVQRYTTGDLQPSCWSFSAVFKMKYGGRVFVLVTHLETSIGLHWPCFMRKTAENAQDGGRRSDKRNGLWRVPLVCVSTSCFAQLLYPQCNSGTYFRNVCDLVR